MDFIEGVPLSRCVLARLPWSLRYVQSRISPTHTHTHTPPYKNIITRLKETMKERGIEEGSPESAIFGRRLLNALTEAYARMLFGPGFIHGDCHPGNICEWVAHTKIINHQAPSRCFRHPHPLTHTHTHAHATVVQPGGRIALIDCGQVKQIPASTKLRLADLVLAVSRYGKEPSPAAAAALSEKVKAFGVEFKADARPEIGGALRLYLMDGWVGRCLLC